MDMEVLIATMGQKDCSLVQKMNIQAPAVIANQCGKWKYDEDMSGNVRMVSTATKGVGINRNIALQLAKADILLFADDDITYYDGALQGVLDAFEELSDADVIFFGIDMTKNGEIFDRRRNDKKRLHLWNSQKYGAARMAVRRSAVEKARLSFSKLFGGGCIYGSGEDSLFICDCFRSGLRVYSHPHILGACAKDTSSWFSGYNQKFMFDRGAWIACAFPRIKHLIKWYYIWHYRSKTELSWRDMRKYMNLGLHAYREKRGFDEAATASYK